MVQVRHWLMPSTKKVKMKKVKTKKGRMKHAQTKKAKMKKAKTKKTKMKKMKTKIKRKMARKTTETDGRGTPRGPSPQQGRSVCKYHHFKKTAK